MDLRLRRDVAWNLIPVALLGGVGLGLNFVIARWWGAGALGTFNIVTIAFFAFAVLGAFGIQFSVLRAVAAHVDDADEVAAIVVGALIPTVLLGLVATAGFVAIRGVVADLQHNPALAEGMLWAAPGLGCFAINKVLFGVVNGLRRMRAFAVYTSLRYLLIAGGLAIAGVTEADAAHLAGIWSFTECALLLVMIGELVATVRLSRGRGWQRWAREHLGYGSRGLTAMIAQEINSKLDVWMLGLAGVGDKIVGVYSLAAVIYEGAMQLGVAVQANLNPIVARALAEGRPAEVESLAARTRKWFVPVMAAACAVGAACYPLVVPWLTGDPLFAVGTLPFAILMAGLALASPYLPFNQILLMASRPGWYTLFITLVVACNFDANALLIPPLGATGAAAAASIAIVISAVLTRWFARRRVGVLI